MIRVIAGLAIALAVTCIAAPAAEPAKPTTQPASPTTQPAKPTTQSAFVPVWLRDIDQARAAAKKTAAPLLLLWHDPTSPAARALKFRTLKSSAIVPLLKGIVLISVDATTPGGKEQLKKAGLAIAPVTQLFAPDGELLSSVGGAPSQIRISRMIEATRDYVAATNATRPESPGGRLAKVKARLHLSTRAKALADIQWLLKLPSAKLPKTTSPAKLQLALGTAITGGDNSIAAKAFGKARELAGTDKDTAAAALLGIARIKAATADNAEAAKLLAEYIATYPDSADVGKAVIQKASIEFAALDDAASAQATLEAFIKSDPDNAACLEARQLLILLTNPTARPADDDDF